MGLHQQNQSLESFKQFGLILIKKKSVETANVCFMKLSEADVCFMKLSEKLPDEAI